jgi:hypothetical protein
MAVILVSAAGGGATVDELRSATQKVDAIKSDRLRAGTRVDLSLAELNAWVRSQAPAGVRDTELRIDSAGVATGSGIVDLAKVSRSQGFDPGWLLSRLLEGERPVKVTARIHSANGSARVDVERAEIGGLEIDGKTLELLIQYVLLRVYPNATVGQSFELGHHIERLDIQPAMVAVVIGAKR